MNDTLRRTWPSALVGVLAALYFWIGLDAHGWDRLFGLTGGVLIITAALFARRSVPAATVLLVAGASPLAVVSWWSITTPVLAVLVLVLGWFAIRARRPRRAVAHPGPRPTD